MTHSEAMEFIHSMERFGSKPGLRRVTMLLERMGNPQKRLKFIHVAGTNGKGSTCAMLSHILTTAGYTTGLNISPFVLDFRERFQVNNEMISPEELASCTTLVKEHWDALNAMGEPPTEFEVIMAIAMEYFARKNCDIVVLEVGMGGRFDATNVIDTPLCSVITSIGIDHTDFLGDTLTQIAFEKCGIIKRGGVTVTYPFQEPEALAVIMEQCALQENPLLSGNPAGVEVLSRGIDGSRIRCDGMEIHIPLAGQHQIYNAITVLETLKAVSASGIEVPPEAVRNGIAATTFPSRLEILSREPMILLDGAHNPSGAKVLRESLELLEGRRVHAVVGMVSDKDIDGVLEIVLPRCQTVTVTAAHVSRAMPAEALAGKARAYCSELTVEEDQEAALKTALARCGKDDVLLIFGSLYLASELRPIALRLSNSV